MNTTKYILIPLQFGLLLLALTSCGEKPKSITKQTVNSSFSNKSNPVVYFEIPVKNMERAIRFYSAVFHFDFEKEYIDNNEMALFPFTIEKSGISGALAKGEIYKPTKDGVVIYFITPSIKETLKQATSNGGKILYPITDNGTGIVAEFEDTEGNRIALYQSN